MRSSCPSGRDRAVVGRPRRARSGITDDDAGTRLSGHWAEADGRPGRLDVLVALPAGHESLNVVIPWSDTCSTSPRSTRRGPRSGALVVGDRAGRSAGPTGTEAWGVLDVGRGRWPHEIAWNWGGGAGRAGDHIVGLQFGAKWTEGSGFTENGAARRRPPVARSVASCDGTTTGMSRCSRGTSSIPAGSSTWCSPRVRQAQQRRRRRVRQRDPPGVRHLVGPAAHRRRPATSSSTASKASPRKRANAGSRRVAEVRLLEVFDGSTSPNNSPGTHAASTPTTGTCGAACSPTTPSSTTARPTAGPPRPR